MAGKRALPTSAALGLLTAACAGDASTLDPAGPRAAALAELHWIMTALAAAVCVAVTALVLWAILRPRDARATPPRETARRDRLLIVGGGIVLPLVVLPLVWALTIRAGASEAAPPAPIALTVEVTGRQWAYEVHYPEHGVTVANEIRIPADVPVLVRVGSRDVIHSFWIPRVAGKFDMIPGRTTERWIQAAAGRYLVECAEFCGLHHARMRMFLVAEPRERFDAWLASRP